MSVPRFAFKLDEGERNLRIADEAIARAAEWFADPDIIQNHFESGDLKVSAQLAELIVAARREGRSAYREVYLRSVGAILLQDIEASFEVEAEKQIREEAQRA